MPGLAGVVSSGKPLQEPYAAVRAFTTVGLVNGVMYSYRSYCDRNAAILNTLTGLLPGSLDQPATDGFAHLFLEGEVFNIDEVRRAAHCPPATPACEALLALFRHRGDSFVELLNGEFNIAIWNRRESRFDLFCDHLASMPMYYAEHGGSLLFGSEKKFLLCLPGLAPTLDPVGLLQIPAHCHNLNDRTFLQGIRRLQAGAHLSFIRKSVRVEHSRALHWNRTSRMSTAPDLCAQWADLLTRSIRRRIAGKERICLSLSGGLDSRALACALPGEMKSLLSRTRAAPGSMEAEVAAEIASMYGFEHLPEDPAAVPPSALVRRIAWRTECETPFMNAVGMSHHGILRDRCRFLMGGWLGGITAGQRIATPMLRPRSRDEFVRDVYRRYSLPRRSLARVFAEPFLTRWLPEVESVFRQTFCEMEAMTNVQAYEAWDLYQRQARQTNSSMPVDSYLFEKIRPFYDKEYVCFTMSLPTGLRYGQGAYQAMIWYSGCGIRHLPCANNGWRLRKTVSGNIAIKVATASSRALGRRVGAILPAYRRALKQRRSEDLGSAMRDDPDFGNLIERFLTSNDCDDAVFNRDNIRAMLSEHNAGVAEHTYLLGHVATLAAGLPYFLRSTPACPPEAEPLEPVTEVRSTTNLSAEQARTVYG